MVFWILISLVTTFFEQPVLRKSCCAPPAVHSFFSVYHPNPRGHNSSRSDIDSDRVMAEPGGEEVSFEEVRAAFMEAPVVEAPMVVN